MFYKKAKKYIRYCRISTHTHTHTVTQHKQTTNIYLQILLVAGEEAESDELSDNLRDMAPLSDNLIQLIELIEYSDNLNIFDEFSDYIYIYDFIF